MDICLVIFCCGVFVDSHDHVAGNEVVDFAPEMGVVLGLEELAWSCVGEDTVELGRKVYKEDGCDKKYDPKVKGFD